MVMTSPDNMQNTSSSPDDDIHSESNKEEFPVLQSQQVPVAAVSQELETPPSGPSTSKPKKSKITADLNLPASRNTTQKRKRKKYQRKRPRRGSEEEYHKLRKKRQAKYEDLRKDGGSNLWDFESLFPDPAWDDEIILKDLYEISDRDANFTKKDKEVLQRKRSPGNATIASPKIDAPLTKELTKMQTKGVIAPKMKVEQGRQNEILASATAAANFAVRGDNSTINSNSTKIDRSLTRMVEDRMYGFRRDQMGEFEYDTSLMGDGAVKFRDGIRLGNSLKVNSDRLNHFAKKELAKGKLEEAEEMYEKAIKIAPRDGRAYLGLSRVAQRRRDFKYAKDCLKTGIANSFGDGTSGANGVKVIDTGGNPFLLQALGTLEERMGNLAEAERLFIAAARSRPSHAAAWVALAQLRTRKLRQGPNAGRMCYHTAETELRQAGLKASSHVYTAWAALEWKAGDIRRGRELFRMALEIDPKCSAAWNQFGVMETQQENWDEAEQCFESVLKYDRRNSRVLQAYAIMETKRPDTNSRRAIGIFEKALKSNPRDGGVLQGYALYVAKLGDIDSARDLLKRGTQIDRRHAPLWQAWGVLETRHGTASAARDVFQRGIWSCAQSSGGQSGGRRCARLWQAWGVLESMVEDHPAARRCFSRALDADTRNVAAVTAWTLMEEKLGNFQDARLIFERALSQFGSQSSEKTSLWRAYELMESQAGNMKSAQSVYQRSIRDAIGSKDDYPDYDSEKITRKANLELPKDEILTESKSNEVEISRWNSKSNTGFGEKNAEVWLNEGSIEGKVPSSTMKKKSRNPKNNGKIDR